jgi:hypothetical protein
LERLTYRAQAKKIPGFIHPILAKDEHDSDWACLTVLVILNVSKPRKMTGFALERKPKKGTNIKERELSERPVITPECGGTRISGFLSHCEAPFTKQMTSSQLPFFELSKWCCPHVCDTARSSSAIALELPILYGARLFLYLSSVVIKNLVI